MSEEFRLSVSKTKTFLDCKKKYDFCYNLKLERKEYAFHTFGKICHSILEYFHNEYIIGCNDPYNIVMTRSYKKAILEYSDKIDLEMKKECRSIIDTYLRKISEQKTNGIITNVLSCEKQFKLQLTDHIVLNGAIDRIQLDSDNVLHVADYKTTKNAKYLANDFFQLLTYAYVILCDNPDIDKVRGSYVLLRHDFKYITTEFSKDQILAVKDKYIKYVESIMAETEFAPNPTPLCNWCDYLIHCEKGLEKVKPQMSFGEKSW